jgi:hypothetical protein
LLDSIPLPLALVALGGLLVLATAVVAMTLAERSHRVRAAHGARSSAARIPATPSNTAGPWRRRA